MRGLSIVGIHALKAPPNKSPQTECRQLRVGELAFRDCWQSITSRPQFLGVTLANESAILQNRT